MDVLQVKKRDGSLEPWNIDKLITSMVRTGVPMQEAQRIASEIENWAKASAQNAEITSVEIRDKVIDMLSAEFPTEAENYKSYKKAEV